MRWKSKPSFIRNVVNDWIISFLRLGHGWKCSIEWEKMRERERFFLTNGRNMISKISTLNKINRVSSKDGAVHIQVVELIMTLFLKWYVFYLYLQCIYIIISDIHCNHIYCPYLYKLINSSDPSIHRSSSWSPTKIKLRSGLFIVQK